MIEDDVIDQAEGKAAIAEPLVAPNLKTAGQQPAPWFAEQVRRKVKEKFPSVHITNDGLSVRTTMDPQLQTIAQRVLREGLETYDRRHGYRGPLAKLDPTADWQKALAGVASPDPNGVGELQWSATLAPNQRP